MPFFKNENNSVTSLRETSHALIKYVKMHLRVYSHICVVSARIIIKI